MQQIISGVNSSWPTIQKILYLHDYLVTNVEYDITYSKYNAYNALVEGSSVCQGYALATVCLLNNIGVNVDLITSEELNHAWNLIELEGEYFYIDATWDDPLGTGETYCRHSNFMIDETGLVTTGHDSTDWISRSNDINTYGVIATSTRYMDYFWKDMITAVPLISTKAGYLSDGQFNIFDFNDCTTISYDRNMGTWYVFDDSSCWYSEDYSSLATGNDVFYYTTQQDIYQIELDGTTTKLYSLSSDELSKGYIYGLKSKGKTLTYILQTEPQGTTVYYGTHKISTLIEKFITRMYQQCLSREPDGIGLEDWSELLENGDINGAGVAEKFIFSNELLARNLSNEDFIDVLYRALLGREADENGKNDWLALLYNADMTRSQVTKEFVESPEFSTICTNYGIERGTYDATIAPLEKFVNRFYTICLGRNPDQVGLYDWVVDLKDKNINGANITKEFLFSVELLSKNLSDKDFIDVLYRALLGREADENGKSDWLYRLNGGNMTRSQVTKEFVESPEFSAICTNYGIDCGTYDISIAPLEKFVDRFYMVCLEREPDQSGLYHWVENLKNNTISGAQIAEQFFFSVEFINKDVSDEEYIELLYNTLMGRPSDERGKSDWLVLVQNGHMTRKEVMNSFIESAEFSSICVSYGITKGSLK